MAEPSLRVGLASGVEQLSLELRGRFDLLAGDQVTGDPSAARLSASIEGQAVRLTDDGGNVLARAGEIRLRPRDPQRSSFVLQRMTVGVAFHWQHEEDLEFCGGLSLESRGRTLDAVNEVPVETYLVAVISSEMSASCPPELLRAHAVISRSWLLAQLEGRAGAPQARAEELTEASTSDGKPLVLIRRWYDRKDHDHFDVCADDHCQRYHGVTRAISPEVAAAVEATRGLVLVHDGALCDARFSKCCGGMTELFSSAWDDRDLPYLQAFPDAPGNEVPFSLPLTHEEHAAAFIAGRPRVWCHTSDQPLLDSILPGMDRATSDFFRWRAELSQEEVRGLVTEKAGIDPGPVLALRPLERGPSGRLVLLEVRGEQKHLRVGKELEIRRLLSPTHLYSSAFTVGHGEGRVPSRFILDGAGWGHGVGLCQIGAAVMAADGHHHEQILAHYYRGAGLERRY